MHLEGLDGLQQLKRYDRAFGDDAIAIFDESALTLNRAVLSQEANDELNASLDRLIVQLSPYFHHREWRWR